MEKNNIPESQLPEEEFSGNEKNESAGNISNNEVYSETIAHLEAQLTEQKDKYLRLYADFDNFKKRTAKEKLDLIQTAGKDIVLTILPALDDFERAEKAATTATDVNTVKEGMNLIYTKLFKALESKGLKPMESIGKDFDVEEQEAITEIPAPTPELRGKVVDEIEKGYFLNDKLIRFAKVIVGK